MVTGLGGVGKTQTAIEYAHRYRNEYSSLLWCVADSRGALASGFSVLARVLDLPQKNDSDLSVVGLAVRRWLESNSGWLLILDNVEDLTLVNEFVPTDVTGDLLITSRLRASGDLGESLELMQMETDEGAHFLLRRAKLLANNESMDSVGAEELSVARQISIELGGLPLALDQAGAFIQETPSTLAEYLSLYRVAGTKLRARRGNAPDHSSVTVTFRLAMERVEALHPIAADLIRISAFVAPEAIPEEIFTKGAIHFGHQFAAVAVDPFEWLAVIEKAGRFALIRRDPTQKTFSVHRLVQDVIKDEMNVEERLTSAGRVVGALNAAFPAPEYRNWPECERLVRHVQLRASDPPTFAPQETVRVLLCAGDYLRERGQFAEADVIIQRALTIAETPTCGDEPVAKSLNLLGQLRRNQGRYSEAETHLSRALAIRTATLGSVHEDTAASLNDLATLYRSQGRYREAEPLYRKALDIRETQLSPAHADTATTLNNLAELFRDQGRYEEAEPLYRRALEIDLQRGADHPDHATTLNNLGALCFLRGRYNEAERFYRECLGIYEKALGNQHRYTATILNNLAELCRIQSRFSEAQPLYGRALQIREEVLGEHHPLTGQSLNNLGLLYYNEGRYSEAESLYRRALAVREESLGTDHSDVAQTLNNLALLLGKIGKDHEAESIHISALRIREKALGAHHPDVAQSLNNLARVYERLGRDHEAELLYQRAWSIDKTILGLDHPATRNTAENYSALLNRLGREEEASFVISHLRGEDATASSP